MAEGSTATSMAYNEPLAVSSRIVSSKTVKKVNSALTHSANARNLGDSESEDEITTQTADIREIRHFLGASEDQTDCQCESFNGISMIGNLDVHGSDSKSQNTAQNLLDEIDNAKPRETEIKSNKRGGTLTKMFRNLRKDKDSGNTSEEGHIEPVSGSSSMSLGKIMQKVNPVGKNNRETMSKVFHRIGDAFQRGNTNSNNDNTEQGEQGSKTSSAKTLGKLIQFQYVSKSKSAEGKQKSKADKKISNDSKVEKENEELREVGNVENSVIKMTE